MEEPPLLLAVHRIVRGVEIEDDLVRCAIVRLQEQVDEQLLDGRWIVTDLVIARRLQAAQLQPVERRLAGHRRAILPSRFELARQHRHQRIVTQFVVVVQILVAKRDPEHPLTDQRHHLVLNEFRTSHVVKARRKPVHHPDGAICRAQKQRPGIRGDRASVERRELVVASGDAAELLELVEEAFDLVALAVDGLLASGTASCGWRGWECWEWRLERGYARERDPRRSLCRRMTTATTWRGRSSSASAQVTSWTSPGEIRRQSGRPFASTRAWIFVLRPPRLRPTQRSPLFF